MATLRPLVLRTWTFPVPDLLVTLALQPPASCSLSLFYSSALLICASPSCTNLFPAPCGQLRPSSELTGQLLVSFSISSRDLQFTSGLETLPVSMHNLTVCSNSWSSSVHLWTPWSSPDHLLQFRFCPVQLRWTSWSCPGQL